MPTFCRHSRLIQNCPICSRELSVEMRPVVSPARAEPARKAASAASTRSRQTGESSRRTSGTGRAGLRVSRLARGAEDGYSSPLVPGLRSSQDADRLAEELSSAALRLERMREAPAGALAAVRDQSEDIEERTWTAFQLAVLGLTEAESGPDEALTRWSSGENPTVALGLRGRRAASSPERVFPAYRAWAARAGSQAAALRGDAAWTPERRFDRVYERLALPGLERDQRFELLVVLGTVGLYDMEAGSLRLGGRDDVTVAAKRVFGIGDTLLLERRAGELARAVGVPLAALDRALHRWGSLAAPDQEAEERPASRVPIRAALGLSGDS